MDFDVLNNWSIVDLSQFNMGRLIQYRDCAERLSSDKYHYINLP